MGRGHSLLASAQNVLNWTLPGSLSLMTVLNSKTVLAGYDKKQAAAHLVDGLEPKTTSKWRPLQNVQEQQQACVQWAHPGLLILSVDGATKFYSSAV